MPISQEEIYNPQNSYLFAPGHATFGQAMAALNVHNGQRWWRLVVHKSDGSWAAATFSDILLANADAGRKLADTPLESLTGLQPTDAVEWDSLATGAALAKADASPSGTLVVTEQGHVMGILTTTKRSAENPADFAKLNQLAGQFVDLKDYGDVLLPKKKKPAPASQEPGKSAGGTAG